MPKWAADVMGYFRARATGARENAAEEAKVNAFVAQCEQSLDWIFDGDPRGMICKAAGNSPQSAYLAEQLRHDEAGRGARRGGPIEITTINNAQGAR
jgi:hypothetical protein